jgi:hypothetical protein
MIKQIYKVEERIFDADFMYRKHKKVLISIMYKIHHISPPLDFNPFKLNNLTFYIDKNGLYTITHVLHEGKFKRLLYLSNLDYITLLGYKVYYVPITSMKAFDKYIRVINMLDTLDVFDRSVVDVYFNGKRNYYGLCIK